MPISETGLPSDTFYLLKIHCPKNALSAIFPILYFLWAFSESRARCSDYVQIFVQFFKFGKISDYVQKFIPFRTNPILYNNLYVFGLRADRRGLSIFAIYRNGRGRGICSDFVFILFIFGNMIQKSEFVYN